MAKKVVAQAPIETVDQVATYVNQRFNTAYTSTDKIRKAREQMLKYYRQDMDHIPSNEGESKVSTAEVRDTVQTLLPQILEPFLTSEGAGVFEPTNEQDVDQAKLETAYTQYVIFTQNKGFALFVNWVTDGLLQKNGYVKAMWGKKSSITPEKYQGLSLDEADHVVQDNDNGAILQINVQGKLPTGQPIASIDDLLGQPPEVVAGLQVDVQLVRELTDERVFLAPVAPENLIVDAGYTDVDLQDCKYVCEVIADKTRADLKAEGYDPVLVDRLSSTTPSRFDAEAKERAGNQGTMDGMWRAGRKDDEVVVVREHYVVSDLDNSGIAKLWKVCTGDSGSNVTLSMEMVSRIPYHAWTPIISAHQHYGDAAGEQVDDLQDIHTVLWRQSLNAVVASNRTRPIVNTVNAGEDTFDDLMQTTPGHPVRVNGPIADSVSYTAPPNTAMQTLPIMEYLKEMVEARTGLSRQAAGLDAEALADSTNMVGAMIMSQSLLRVKMMLRTFAETGVRSLMEHVRELVMKNEKRQRMFEFTGKFVPIDPTDWRGKRSTIIRVGLGYADKVEKMASLQSAYSMMKEVVDMQGGVDGPLVKLENSYNLLSDMLVAQGLVTKGRYLTDPTANPPEPQPPSPTAIDVAEAELVANNTQAEAKLKADMRKHDIDTRVKLIEIYLQDQRERESLHLQGVKTLAEINQMAGLNDNGEVGASEPSAVAA